MFVMVALQRISENFVGRNCISLLEKGRFDVEDILEERFGRRAKKKDTRKVCSCIRREIIFFGYSHYRKCLVDVETVGPEEILSVRPAAKGINDVCNLFQKIADSSRNFCPEHFPTG